MTVPLINPAAARNHSATRSESVRVHAVGGLYSVNRGWMAPSADVPQFSVKGYNRRELVIITNKFRDISSRVGGVPFTRPWDDARKALTQWRALADDWDGDDTPLVGANAYSRMENAINIGVAMSVSAPTPYFAGDGEIGLRWRSRGLRAVLSFRPDDEVVAFCALPSGTPLRVRTAEQWQTERAEFLHAIGRYYYAR